MRRRRGAGAQVLDELGLVGVVVLGRDVAGLAHVAVVVVRHVVAGGELLVEAGLAHARDHGTSRVVLATAAADTGVLRFYQRLGFRLLRIERDAFTPAAGYPAERFVDGIRLRDRAWLDITW